MNFRQEKFFLTNIIIYLTFFLLWVIISFSFFEYKAKNTMLKNSEIIKNNTDLNLDKFNLIYEKIKNEYYDFSEVDLKDLEESSIVWLVNWLKDPYTEYFNKQENDDFMDSLSWDFEGIWAVLEKNDLWVKIVSVLENSPAKDWDLRPFDIITNVNWTDISNMSTQEVIKLIKGPSWKEVNLVIKREDEILEKKLFTWEVTIPSVSSKEFENEIWYIWLSTFWEKTAEEFEEKLEKFFDKKWIIIDLRQNGGWYLEVAVKILSKFINKWEVLVYTKYRNWEIEKLFSYNKNWVYNWKIVILIDWVSASASEIVAWAMKDYWKAILVWEKTYWKGSVQTIKEFSDGSSFKYTTAKWFTWKTKTGIDWIWINPDIEIKFDSEKFKNFKIDNQLERALNI